MRTVHWNSLLAVLLALVLPVAALAEAFTLGPALEGVICWPDGTTEADARYVYRYSYPTVEGVGELPNMINGTYTYLVEDALAFTVPINAESLEPSDIQASTTITHEITCYDSQYLSVKLTTTSFLGASAVTIMTGHTYALTGAKAGTVVSLPYLLGILDMDEEDEWLKNRQTQKADACVRGLVWEIIQEQMADGAAYDPDLDEELLAAVFYPEEDFYLDQYGNPVFFLQEATIAPASEGILLFPFTMEELLDEI